MGKLLVNSQRVKVGARFGRLEIIGVPFACYFQGRTKLKRHFAVARCDCGNRDIVSVSSLLRARQPTKSCGCKTVDKATTRGGLTQTEPRLYQIWNGMIQRCYNKKRNCYPDYGGRGIFVCDEWRQSAEAFVRWARLNGYADDLEIDRRDNDRGYSPDNCRWVNDLTNGRNTRRCQRISAFNEEKCLTEWSGDARCVVEYGTLVFRVRKGWAPEDAITRPTRRRR